MSVNISVASAVVSAARPVRCPSCRMAAATLSLTYLPNVSRRYSRSDRPSTMALKRLTAWPISSSDVTGRRTARSSPATWRMP